MLRENDHFDYSDHSEKNEKSYCLIEKNPKNVWFCIEIRQKQCNISIIEKIQYEKILAAFHWFNDICYLIYIKQTLEVTPGTVDSIVDLLKEGHIVAISPGGAREALFSNHNYECMWGKRLGFAKSAVEAAIVSLF